MSDEVLDPSDAFDESRIIGDVKSGLHGRDSGILVSPEGVRSLEAFVTQLRDTLSDKSLELNIRADAAWAIGKAAASSKRHCGGCVPAEILSAIDSLSSAATGQDEDVRRSAIEALGEFGTSASRTVVDALATGPLAQENSLPRRICG